jgi:hypothetical protein
MNLSAQGTVADFTWFRLNDQHTNRQVLEAIASFLGIELQLVRPLEGIEEFNYHLFADLGL